MRAIALWVGENIWLLCRLLLVWCRLLLLSLSAFFFRIAQCMPSNDESGSRSSSTDSLFHYELINRLPKQETPFHPAPQPACVDSSPEPSDGFENGPFP